MESLKREYLAARLAAAAVINPAQPEGAAPSEEAPAAANTDAFALWPKSMMDFLSQRLRSTFEVRAYLLDPAKLTDPKDGEVFPQPLPDGSEPIDGDHFKGLMRSHRPGIHLFRATEVHMIRRHTSAAYKQRGQGMSEYIIITALVAVASIGLFAAFGDVLKNQMAGMSREMAGQSAAQDITDAQSSATTAQGRAARSRLS